MLKIISRTIRLNTLILFNVARPRRDPSIPTEASFLRPFSVNFLNDNQGSRIYPKLVGRGPGSGKGKFAARGMKGHNARAGGGVHVRFQGGQNPITKRLKKYGRVKRNQQKQILTTINLESIDYFVKKGILNAKKAITIKDLVDCGLAKKVKYGIKILGKGLTSIDYPLHLQVSDASSSVIKHIQSNGGSVKLIFRTQLKLRQHIYPQKFPLPLADPLPPAWRVRKLDRIQRRRNHKVVYRKPLWKIDEQKEQAERQPTQKEFIFPVPRISDPKKIHKRKPRLYRQISYGLS